MALTCCFCGQTVGSRTAKYPVRSDFNHVMCADCSGALECVRSTTQGDSSYRNQAINYFRQKLDLGLVEPSMKDFLIDTMTAGPTEGNTARRPARAPVPAETAGGAEKLPLSSGNTFWIISCRVLLILLCAAILTASVFCAVRLSDGNGRTGFLSFILSTGLDKDSEWIVPGSGILLSFAILSVGMQKLDRARDVHQIRNMLIKKRNEKE